jgi:hypothetical protein
MAAKKAPMRKMAAPKPAPRKAPVKKAVATKKAAVKKSTASSKNLTPAQQKALAARNKVRGGQGATSKTRTLTRAESTAMGKGSRRRTDYFGQKGFGETGGERNIETGGIEQKQENLDFKRLQSAYKKFSKQYPKRTAGGRIAGPKKLGMSTSPDAESVIWKDDLKYVSPKARNAIETALSYERGPISKARKDTRGYEAWDGGRYLSREQSKAAGLGRLKGMKNSSKSAPKTQKYRGR